MKECRQCDGKGHTQNREAHQDAPPKEDLLNGSSFTFFGFEGLSGCPRKEELCQIAAMQQSRRFNESRYLKGEEGKEIVDVIEHATTGIDLGGNLADHGRHEEESQPGIEKDLVNGHGHAQDGNGLIEGISCGIE